MTARNPFDLLGTPDTWPRFGEDEHDLVVDGERRAMLDFFLRRLAKLAKRGHDADAPAILASGAMVAFANFFVSASGGPEAMTEKHYDAWLAMATFSWYQSLSTQDSGGVQ